MIFLSTDEDDDDEDDEDFEEEDEWDDQCLFVCFFSFSPLPKPPIPQFPNQMITTLKLYLEKEIVNFKIINVNVLLICCIFFVAFMPFY